MDHKEQIKKLLDDFYGDCRSDDHKEEIITFIDNYMEDLSRIYGLQGYPDHG